MLITEEERKILEHVVRDADAWVAAAVLVGDWAVREKIDRYREAYLAAVALPDYKNRVERDAAEATLND